MKWKIAQVIRDKSGKVLSLPIRNWNPGGKWGQGKVKISFESTYKELKFAKVIERKRKEESFESTYKELKSQCLDLWQPSDNVLSLPIRNWNNI